MLALCTARAPAAKVWHLTDGRTAGGLCRPAGHQCNQSKDHHGKTPAKQENGAVLLTDDGRKAFLTAWQNKKKEEITHPFLKEKLPWGLVPYVQALLLARALRGDLEVYPPFFWK